MSTLSSATTLEQTIDAYLDNASYAEDGSTAKAQVFITACRMLLVRLPKKTESGRTQSTVEMDLGQIRKEMDAAKRWLSSRRSGGQVTHLSLENFRD